MIEFKVAPQYNREFCYERVKMGKEVIYKLYEDTTMPRIHIANISGNTLDGFVWQAVEGAMENDWEMGRAPSFKAAMMLCIIYYGFLNKSI